MHPDRRLDEFAARQYGVFSLDQARSVGITRAMIETRRTSGAWICLAPSVYVVASAPPKWERQVAAALLGRPGSLVASSSAAHLHDFPGFRAGRPVIMVGEKGNARSPLARVIRSRYFEDLGTIRKGGFVVTDESDTVVTIARSVTSAHLERVVDEILARDSGTAEQMMAVIAKRPGAQGLGELRPIVEARLADAYQPPTSELERILFGLIESAPIPPATRQVPFTFRGVNATVDLYIPAWRLIVEADGRRWHTRKADQERDRLRDNEAVAHGYAVLRFTWSMLTQSANTCLDQLLRTGRVRTAS